MSNFIFHGPLPYQSNLFKGRRQELDKLIHLCRGDVKAYAIIYGGRQMGKSSLLIQLKNQLPHDIRTCCIDFQAIPGADSALAFTYLIKKVLTSLGMPAIDGVIKSPIEFMELLSNCLAKMKEDKLCLLIEEMGAISEETRKDLANIFRSIFQVRNEESCWPFSHLMIVIAGNLELYNLAFLDVSPLSNICEKIYLPDLTEQEAIELVCDGLFKYDPSFDKSLLMANKVYSIVSGHPYLTQRLGGYLEEITPNLINDVTLDNVIDKLITEDHLLMHLMNALNELKLINPICQLLQGKVRFSRLNLDMARLEILGIIKVDSNKYWKVKNPLFEQLLQSWVNEFPLEPKEEITNGKFHIEITAPSSIVIGDQSKVVQKITKEL